MATDDEFERLLDDAVRQPFSGWDFTWLDARMSLGPVPWDFAEIVAEHARRSPDLLDLGTGGGEWLSALPYRPPTTVATESWQPNVAVARHGLAPLGVPVVRTEGAPDNVDQLPDDLRGRLPFLDGCLHLVCDRHESYRSAEVARVLAPGGRFLTQQVGGGVRDGYYDLLGLPRPAPAPADWSLPFAGAQLATAGLTVLAGGEAVRHRTVDDVGALAWYLAAVPWTVPEFSVAACRERLRHLHERRGGAGLTVREPMFWLAAVKSGRGADRGGR